MDNTTFVNLVDIKVSGTATRIKQFNEYKSQLSGGEDIKVYIIKQPGQAGFNIYYITKTKDTTYYYPDRSFVGILGDWTFTKQAGILKAQYRRNIYAVVFDTIILFCVSLLIVRPSFESLRESLKNLRGKKI